MRVTGLLSVAFATCIANVSLALNTSDSVAAWLTASRIAVAESIASELNPNVAVRKADVRAYINCISDLAAHVDSKSSIFEVAKACPRITD